MKNALKIIGLMGLVLLYPSVVQAHSIDGTMHGWQDGFDHPLHGWDHLLVMVAVGLWAAQQRSRAVWLYPLIFVIVMGLGGAVGAAGMKVPGIETGILLSVVVFVGLVGGRVELKQPLAIAILSFSALCHGYAHGAEMPRSIGIITFGLGFMLATLLLHLAGLITGRLVGLGLLYLTGASAIAQEATSSSGSPSSSTNPPEPIRLPEVVVTGRQDSMLGIADSASQGTTGAAQLAERPILRSGEILETVPGVIITQHAGGGKANQYFLRGFNLDHGTDFAVFLDGMPLNLPSHAHGEGYSDMNVVIPEFVRRVDYEKGPYYANIGNYGSAGAAHLVFYDSLPQNFATVEGGMYGYARGVFGISQKVGTGTLLYGGEAYHDDGPWTRPDDYQKFNGILTYSQGDEANGYSVNGRAYHGKWYSSDQIPNSFGETNFFGTLNPTDGGSSGRYSLQAEWHRHDGNSETKILVYGFHYDLDLFSDFTYFLTDTNRGDQFEQQDKRWVAGLDGRHTIFSQWFNREVENSFGLQVRNDWIDNGLYQAQNRVRVDKLDSDTGTVLPATTQAHRFTDTLVGIYAENKTHGPRSSVQSWDSAETWTILT